MERRIEALIFFVDSLGFSLPLSSSSISNLMSFPTSITVMLYGQAALKKNRVSWNLFSTLGVRLFFVGNVTLPPLGLMTLTLRRKLHTAQLVFRCLSSEVPSYLSRLFSSPSTYRNTRSTTTHQLNLPALKTSLGQRAFSFAGASL